MFKRIHQKRRMAASALDAGKPTSLPLCPMIPCTEARFPGSRLQIVPYLA